MTMEQQDELARLRDEVAELNRKVGRLIELVAESTLDNWRGRIEQVQLQARLGQMELRDEAAARLDQADERWQSARRSLDDLGEKAGEAWDELVDRLRPALADIRDAVEQATRSLRS